MQQLLAAANVFLGISQRFFDALGVAVFAEVVQFGVEMQVIGVLPFAEETQLGLVFLRVVFDDFVLLHPQKVFLKQLMRNFTILSQLILTKTDVTGKNALVTAQDDF